MRASLLVRTAVLVAGVLGLATCSAAAPRSGPGDPLGPDGPRRVALDEQLRDAAWDNDVRRARVLIERGADVNAKDDTEQSAYLIATSEGHLKLLDLTLEHGARVDSKDGWNGTGLIRAAERGHAAVVGRLLSVGIDRDHVNRIGYQAIHEAVWLGEDTTRYVDTVRALVAGGVELTRKSDNEALTPLQMAQQRGYPALEATLRRALAPTEISDPDTTLLSAAAAGDADRVARALRAGAEVDHRDPSGRTALLLAVSNDRADVARLLVTMGADPDAVASPRGCP